MAHQILFDNIGIAFNQLQNETISTNHKLLVASGLALHCRNPTTRRLSYLLESLTVRLGAKRFFNRDQAIAFQPEQQSQTMVCYRSEIFHKPPAQDLGEHVLKIIIFGIALGLIINSKIDRLMLALRVVVMSNSVQYFPVKSVENFPLIFFNLLFLLKIYILD